ncbi:nuclear transport factor 2 family protein [Xanthomonas sacchari]|uniref:nuclear transport factor 2 family protein n=1 Tax=Xanthomonas sacchari TaxID=56458 RepID=UPI0009E1AF1C|nr:nuclear transport factor 2 family protein [Xanthomonas sacchari]
MTFNHFFTSSLLAPLLLSGCSHTPIATSGSYAEAERYIIDCSRDWAESVVTGDRSKRKIYFADDFIGTDTKGRRYDKSQVTRETGPAKQIVSNTLHDVSVRFFGDTAIAHGSETWTRKDGSTGQYVWTDIWIKRDGRWQVVAAQDAAAAADGAAP